MNAWLDSLATSDSFWTSLNAFFGAVLGVILALMIGGGVLMGTIAFAVEKSFDVQR